jgi:DedD protein
LNTRYETERDLRDFHETTEQDREISLGTTTILGIFFALALLCAVVFGFGYSLGRRSAPPVANTVEPGSSMESTGTKPSPGSLASQTASAPATEKPAADTVQSETVPLDSQPADTAPPETVVSSRPSPRNESAAKAASKSAAGIPVSTVTPSPGSPIVQIAAMSHQEDADIVAVDLKRRGYSVAIRKVPQDKLFHVQIGPFANRKEADTMRQRLQGDGYNSAIVK